MEDLAINKKVFLRGKKVGGIQSISLDYSSKGDMRTLINLKIAVPKDSIKITGDEIHFDIFWDDEPRQPGEISGIDSSDQDKGKSKEESTKA